MANGQLNVVISQLRRLVRQRGGCALADAQLLANFIGRQDEASFEVLVWRHGPMVLTLCQGILRDSHAAEDAFQATFLVFARKAATIGKREAIASWLYKVAYRIALRLRAKTVKRSAREEAGFPDDLPEQTTHPDVNWRELRPVLDEEIGRLPEKFRVPMVLCYLEGQTNEEAAEQLGCPKGTILSRLARGRERLRSRLNRRGLALSAAWLGTALSQNVAAATVPAGLVNSTVKAATVFAAGNSAAVSTSVVTLAQGVLYTMFLAKLKIAFATILTLAILVPGTGLLVHRALAERSDVTTQAAPEQNESANAVQERERERARERNPASFIGKVVAVGQGGKTITLEIPDQRRDRERSREQKSKKIEITITEKTTASYSSVGPNGARPTEGYFAQVWLARESKDVAEKLNFRGQVGFRRGPDFNGIVREVSKDGKKITVAEVRRGREGDSKVVHLDISGKTQLVFALVGKGGAEPKAGYMAQIWLEEGDAIKETISPAKVYLLDGSQDAGRREERRPVITAKVVALAPDGKSLAVEIPSRDRNEESIKKEIKFDEKTPILFHHVGRGLAKITEGAMVQVWLKTDSKDQAAKMVFAGEVRERDPLVPGKLVAISRDGKVITLEQPSRNRGDEPKKIEIKITPKTQLAYFGVAAGGAQLTEGYLVQVRLVNGSTETAAQIMLSKSERGQDRR